MLMHTCQECQCPTTCVIEADPGYCDAHIMFGHPVEAPAVETPAVETPAADPIADMTAPAPEVQA